MNGILNVLKVPGPSSSDVVTRVRNALTRACGFKIKCGHLGTLDPGAAGVLPVAVGKATKLFDYFLDKDKFYRAGICFCKETDTLDAYGAVTKRNGAVPSEAEVRQALTRFLGEIRQVPPAYSAVSVGGRRAYALARAGKVQELPARTVRIDTLTIVSYQENRLVLDIRCSAGTYIRSLVRDLAAHLQTCAYMDFLIRLASGPFYIEDANPMDALLEDPVRFVTPMEDLFAGNARYVLNRAEGEKLLNGLSVCAETDLDAHTLLTIEDKIYGLVHTQDKKIMTETRLWS